MPIKIAVQLLTCLFITLQVHAQYYLPENTNWAFSNTGMSFNNDSIAPIASSTINGEGVTAISDEWGNLLFYSNGSSVWSADGNLMPHSSSLDLSYNETFSVTQNALIIPVPLQSNKYYLFTLGFKLFVYLIDMSLNDGKGDIDTTFNLTHIKLADSLTEKMIAIQGCTRTVWVVTKSLNSVNNGVFLCFKVSESGIDTIPVMSFAGNEDYTYGQGVMCASPNGQLIAVTNFKGIELMNFDGTNGKISNKSIIDTSVYSYGTCFSPSGRFLYSSGTAIYQYDLANCNPLSTRTFLGNSMISNIILAINGKIYFRALTGISTTEVKGYLGSIEIPDSAGIACYYRDTVPEAVIHPQNNELACLFSIGIHNTVVNPNKTSLTLNRRYFDTCMCAIPESGLTLTAASGFEDYTWNTSATDTQLLIDTGGVYWVRYLTPCGYRSDTFTINTILAPIQLSYNDSILSCQGAYDHYQWLYNGILIENANDSFYVTSEDGVYTLIATIDNGCSDTASYQIGTNAILPIEKKHINVFPNPVQTNIYLSPDFKGNYRLLDMKGNLMIEDNKSSIDVSSFQNGIYLLSLYDNSGNLLQREKIVKMPN